MSREGMTQGGMTGEGMTRDDMIAAVLDRRPQTQPIIDAHAHIGPYGAFPIPNPWDATMLAIMDRTGVRQACISSLLGLVGEAAAGNDLTAEVTARHPDRFRGYAIINPHQRPEHELRRALALPGMIGIKLHPDLHQYPMTGPKYQPVWEVADAFGLLVLVHGFDGSPFNSPEHFARIAGKYPNARILMGHSGAVETGFEKAMSVAREHANLYLELCGSWMTGRWLRRMVQECGADRIVFGSDFPFIDLRFSLGRVLFADLSASVRAAILAGNAAALLEASTAGVRRYGREVSGLA